jgi:hypothetical protein
LRLVRIYEKILFKVIFIAIISEMFGKINTTFFEIKVGPKQASAPTANFTNTAKETACTFVMKKRGN